MAVAHDPILSTARLTVKVRRSGGFAGLRTSTSVEVAPGSPAHDAALRVCATPPPADGSPADGMRYEVTITAPRATLLQRTYSEPLPELIGGLLDSLSRGS